MQASSPIITTTSTTTATTSIIQYACSHCNTVLKTNIPEAIVEQSAINEDCPTCGYPLSQYATQVRIKRSSGPDAPLKPAQFSLASDCGKLTFGIAELDNRFALWTGG